MYSYISSSLWLDDSIFPSEATFYYFSYFLNYLSFICVYLSILTVCGFSLMIYFIPLFSWSACCKLFQFCYKELIKPFSNQTYEKQWEKHLLKCIFYKVRFIFFFALIAVVLANSPFILVALTLVYSFIYCFR